MTAERRKVVEKPRAGRRILRLLLWSLALLAAVLALAWGLLESDWIREKVRLAVEQQAGEALGREVSVGAIDFDLWSLSVEAEAIVVGGPQGLEKPLASIGSLALEIGPGLLRGLRGADPLVLQQIRVVDAVVELRFAEDGTSNLPDLGEPGEPEGGLEVRLEALDVVNGTLRIDERSMPLDLSARGVAASLHELAAGGHRARAESAKLSVRLPEAEPLEASLVLDAHIDEGAVTIERAALESPRLDVDASGEVGGGNIDVELSGVVETELLDQLGWAEGIGGSATFEGRFSQLAQDWSLNGTWRAPRLTAAEVLITEAAGDFDGGNGDVSWTEGDWSMSGSFQASSLSLQDLSHSVSDLSGSFESGPQGLEATLASANLSGARVQGRVVVPFGDAAPPIDLDVELSGLDLGRLLDVEEPLLVGLGGAAYATLLYRFDAEAPELGRGSGTLRIEPVQEAEEGTGVLMLSAAAAFDIAAGRLSSEDAVVETSGTRIVFSGGFDLRQLVADLDFSAAISEPRALLDIVPAIRDSPEVEPWEPSHGEGTVMGSLRAGPSGFRTEVELAFEKLLVAEAPIARGSGRLVVDSGGIQVMDLVLHHGEARLAVDGAVPFEDAPPTYPPPDLGIGILAEGWQLADADAWLPFEVPVDGRVSGSVTVAGSLDEPAGTLDLTVDRMVASGIELPGSVAARVDYGPRRIELAAARYSAPFGELELAGTVDPTTQGMDLRLFSSPLDLAAPPIDDWVVGDLTGWVEVSGTLGGTFESPALDLALTATGVDLAGRPLGADGSSRLALRTSLGEVEVEGSLLGLVSLAGGGRWDASGADVEVVVESDMLAEIVGLGLEQVPEGLGGALEGRVVIRGAEDTQSARIVLDRFELEHDDQLLRNIEPVVVSLTDAGASLDSLYLEEVGSGSELFMAGSLGSPGDGELDLVVQSSIDASWIGLYLPEFDIRGRLEVLAKVRGTPAEPRLDGQSRIVDGRLIVEGFPHALEDIESLIFLYPDQIVVDSAAAVFARGELTADGSFIVAGDLAGTYEFRIRGSDLDIRYPEDWRVRTSGRLTLFGSAEGRLLSGTVEVERAAFVRDFDLGLSQLLRGMFQRRPELVDETDEILLETRLNIKVQGPDALQVTTNMATLGGDLDFTVRGNLAHPVILGDVRLARGGTLSLGGSEYTVERGSLVFSNPFRNDPSVDLVASATVREFDVRLNVFGPLGQLETSVSSTPPMASLDVLSLLTTGSSDTLGEFGSGSLVESDGGNAESFLAGQAASIAGRRVGTLFGLDQVQISPLTGGTSQLSAARVTVGKRISRDVYITYSHDPSESDEEIVELTWQIYPSIAVVITATDRDSYSMDLRWNKSF